MVEVLALFVDGVRNGGQVIKLNSFCRRGGIYSSSIKSSENFWGPLGGLDSCYPVSGSAKSRPVEARN